MTGVNDGCQGRRIAQPGGLRPFFAQVLRSAPEVLCVYCRSTESTYAQVKARVIIGFAKSACRLCGEGKTIVVVLKLVTLVFLAGLGLLMVFQLFDSLFSTLAAAAAVAVITAAGAGWWQARKANRLRRQYP